MNEKVSGKCSCGSVAWEADLPPKIVLICHCNMCRELSGADYSTWVVVKSENFTLLKGAELLNSYHATENFSKSFCSACGSTVNCVNNDKFPDHVYIARGNIVSDIELPANIQVYTADKADWVVLDDTIPAYNP